MSEKVVVAELHLPVWAIEMIESEEEYEGERADNLYDWLDSFETCGNPEVIVMDDKPTHAPHALFDGDKTPSKSVMLVGILSNVSKIKRFYATLGREAFFEKLIAGKKHFAVDREDSEKESLGTVQYSQWQTIAESCPAEEKDIEAITNWCQFNNPLCQVWTVWMLEQ